MPDTQNALGLTSAQLAHSKDIVATAKQMGLSQRDANIGIMTAITESGIRELANTNVPASLNYPHEGIGSDHASLGEFQQQTPGWGTVSQLMQPHIDASKFFAALKTKTNRASLQPWQVAQEVQHSAYSDGSNYRANWMRAQTIGNALWPIAGPGDTQTPGGALPYPVTIRAPLSPAQRTKIIAFIEARGISAKDIGQHLDPIAFGGPVDLNNYIQHGNAAQDALLISLYAVAAAGGGIQTSPKTKETNSIVDAVKGVGDSLASVGAFFDKLGWIFNVDHFMRFLLYAGGAGAVLAGLFMIAHSSKD